MPKAAASHVDHLILQARGLASTNIKQSFALLRKAYKQAEQQQNKTGMAAALRVMGANYDAQSKYAQAREHYLQSLKLYEHARDEKGVAMVYNNLGILHFRLVDYVQAIHYYLQSLKIKETLGDQRSTCSTLTNIGSVYLNQGNLPEALKYYKRAVKIAKAAKDDALIGTNFQNMGYVLLQQEKPAEALKMLHQAVRYLEKSAQTITLASVYINIGLAHQKQRHYAEALRMFEKSMTVCEKEKLDYQLTQVYINLTELSLHRKKTSEAASYLLLLKKLLKRSGGKSGLHQYHQLMAQLYEQQKDFRLSLHHYKLYAQELKHFMSTESVHRVNEMHARYDIEKREQEAEIERLKNVELRNAYDELRSTQEQLIQQEKLASLGQLTAGIAHEIKNPLNFVNNLAALGTELLEELKTAEGEEREEVMDSLSESLKRINEHGQRANSIVQSMMMHSREAKAEKSVCDLNGLLDEATNLSYHGMKANGVNLELTIERQYDPALSSVKILEQDIHRLFINIISNALYAMYEKQRQLGKEYLPVLQLSTTRNNHLVDIHIRDNGPGMNEEVKRQVFEPFFTTKPPGKGTGLGLSISHDIAKAHGGYIQVQSAAGQYTAFTVRLKV